MKICWGNHIPLKEIAGHNGFGYATKKVVESLRAVGHTVDDTLDKPDVELWFDQPHWVRWRTSAYRIIYVPWESTGLVDGWLERMNSADEVWTPSPRAAEWFVAAGINKPVHVYPHGVDKIWGPVRRSIEGTFNLFHHGGEAARKGWGETLQMFAEHFSGKDTLMNFKMQLPGWNVPVPKVLIMDKVMSLEELVALYQRMNLMVYPSWGEGFGLTPLQAMATGMPVLITSGWAPYEYLLPRECIIESELVDSPWPKIHPGKMFKPDYDDMCKKALYIYCNYDAFEAKFAELVTVVAEEYDWSNLTEKMFLDLEKRL